MTGSFSVSVVPIEGLSMHKTRTLVKIQASGLLSVQIEDHRGPAETSYGDI